MKKLSGTAKPRPDLVRASFRARARAIAYIAARENYNNVSCEAVAGKSVVFKNDGAREGAFFPVENATFESSKLFYLNFGVIARWRWLGFLDNFKIKITR